MYPFQITVLPAYGRDYKNKRDILADYLANKDFETIDIASKGKINKSDCQKMGIACLIVRYKNNQRLASINVIKNKMN